MNAKILLIDGITKVLLGMAYVVSMRDGICDWSSEDLARILPLYAAHFPWAEGTRATGVGLCSLAVWVSSSVLACLILQVFIIFAAVLGTIMLRWDACLIDIMPSVTRK